MRIYHMASVSKNGQPKSSLWHNLISFILEMVTEKYVEISVFRVGSRPINNKSI